MATRLSRASCAVAYFFRFSMPYFPPSLLPHRHSLRPSVTGSISSTRKGVSYERSLKAQVEG